MADRFGFQLLEFRTGRSRVAIHVYSKSESSHVLYASPFFHECSTV